MHSQKDDGLPAWGFVLLVIVALILAWAGWQIDYYKRKAAYRDAIIEAKQAEENK